MANYLIQDSTLTDIADAIRGKTGSQATIDVADFATEISNIPSGSVITPITIHEGRLNVTNGTITADSDWYYTDPFECPSTFAIIDIGEATDYAGFELIYASDNSHANYWNASSRYRAVNVSSAYSAEKKARFTFKKQYLNNVLFMDVGHGKLYTNATFSLFDFEASE